MRRRSRVDLQFAVKTSAQTWHVRSVFASGTDKCHVVCSGSPVKGHVSRNHAAVAVVNRQRVITTETVDEQVNVDSCSSYKERVHNQVDQNFQRASCGVQLSNDRVVGIRRCEVTILSNLSIDVIDCPTDRET